MATFWYGKAVQSVLSKQINLVSDDIKVALFTATYAPNVDTDTTLAGITANQATGAGYTSGGLALANKTLTQDTATNVWKFDADDITFAAASISFRYAVIYDNTNGYLVGYVDFGTTQTATNQDLTIRWESGTTTGILEVAY